MARTCPNCGSSEIDDDSSRGDSTCMGCGTVLEESTIVSDVTFQENSGGGHSLVGQFVSKDRGQPNNLAGVPGLAHQESREITYYKGRKLIEEIASQLRINQHCVNTAFNFFKMCVSRNFTRGRVRSHVVAACLYMTCRLENTAHLLLDFSDITQVNVFDLGRTLNFLARSLKINLPTTDPCMYILRFAVLLDFGSKEKEVVTLATRLVQRMKRDWIATGRRPTGVCGAALLLAARCYNFNRTVADVVRVVHVSEAVVRKRLDEFGQTPSSSLTIDEFTTVDLEHCEDPPAFRESRRRARELQLQKEEEALRKIEPEMQPMEAEVERALEKRRRERFKRTRYAQMFSGSLGSESDELSFADDLVRNEIVDLVFSAAREAAPIIDAGISSTYAPSLVSLGITPLKREVQSVTDIKYEKNNNNEELDLEGIDDDEIDTYILTKEEVDLKTRFWMKLNGEHLEEMERRRREKEEEEEREKDNPTKKRRRTNGVRKKEPIMAATAQEAMEKVIQEKKLSNKINYDILKEIEDTDETIKPEVNIFPKEEIDELNDNKLSHTKKIAHTQSTDDKKDVIVRRNPKNRKLFRPNLNKATKTIVEKAIISMSASDIIKNSCEEEKVSEDLSEKSIRDETSKRKIQNESCVEQDQFTDNPDSKSNTSVVEKAFVTATDQTTVPSTSRPESEKVDYMQDENPNSLITNPENPLPNDSEESDSLNKKINLEGNQATENICNFANKTTAEANKDCSEKKVISKSRYAKMRPNLKLSRPEKSATDVSTEISTNVTELSVRSDAENKLVHQEKQSTEVSVAPMISIAEDVCNTNAPEDSPRQNKEQGDSTLSKSEKPQSTSETRSRYFKAKPNLQLKARIKTTKKS